MSYHQPGPYGQPPQPPQGPNPYGQGGAPGQPGYGYPQQPQAPYGAPPPPPGAWGQPQPPGPYGQQPMPGMPGQYPPPVPPQGGGKGKAIGITIGALVVVGAVVGGFVFLKGGKDDDGGGGSGSAKAVQPYTIELPQALLDGKYTKVTAPGGQSGDDSKSLADDAKAKEMGIEGGTGVSGSYTSAEKQKLMVVGAYGQLADPKKTVDAMIARMDESEKKNQETMKGLQIQTVTAWTEFTPAGFDGAVMKCETKKSTYTMGAVSSTGDLSVCIWGDSSAMGIVRQVVSKTSGGIAGGVTSATGEGMSAKELSDATVKVRNEVRKNK
ncbi:hypothetical protein BLA24_20815 [Streptomyces cinnamoneus]|uniref:Uncharacterized protein n=1 Tax=Streptomyces cinnamoneus TaxID=53446 RepID=A0A2G1XFN5_STRCJ|nr:hypothetical protein [Streptomyces cinnamoneus]PHQ50050.1 hypothetical protein BLA24_20815 [Streptomyces cinnamoneus]PPT13171.1 hypothetical protein CYQ11_09965 [Streptomyces cinnamoneus]